MIPDFAGFGPAGTIVSFSFAIAVAILILRSKYSKGSLESSENEAKSTFIKEMIDELSAVKKAANAEIEKYKAEAHESHVKWTQALVDVARTTEVNRGLAQTNVDLVGQNRELGHANQNLKQLVILYAPDKVKDRILNSAYGLYGAPDEATPTGDMQ